MKKVLIIGSDGMLGKELVRKFSEHEGYSVFGWDLQEIDITKKEEMKKILDLVPHIIINAAAYNDVDMAELPDEREKSKLLNGVAPGYLAEVARDLEAIFVQYSSDYVFDGLRVEGYTEGMQPNPISCYGESKALGERETRRNCKKYYLIRLQKLFGPPSKNPLAKDSFFEKMLLLAKFKDEIQAVNSELGNFTYAPDLADRTRYLIENRRPYGTYHITNEGKPVTWYGGVKILFEMVGIRNVKLVSVSPDAFPRPAKRPKFVILLNTKLNPMRRWTDALEEFLSLQR